MTVQAAHHDLIGRPTTQRTGAQRLGLSVLFLLCEVAIVVFGAYYYDVFPTNRNLAYSVIVVAVCLAAVLWLRNDRRLYAYWPVAFAFLLVALALLVSAVGDGWIRATLRWFAATTATARGQAIEKVSEMILKAAPILILGGLARADLRTLYLQRGKLKLGLGIGALVFCFLASATFMFAAQRFTAPAALAAAVGWGIVFSGANAFMEELWLRATLLQRFQTLIGTNAAVWVTALAFATMHAFALYFQPAALPFFFLNTLALGLACGYLMIRSDSIWGPVLIHAASDFFLFIAVLAPV